MALTFAQLQSLLNDITGADKLLGVFPYYINHACGELQQRRSWVGMKSTVTVVIPGGNGQVDLPSNFKEPQSGYNPLTAANSALPGGVDMWSLYSKQEMERLGVIGCDTPDNKAYIDLDTATGNMMLVTLGQVGTDTTFYLDSYLFMPELVNTTDTNWLTMKYPMLVLEQAKLYVFQHLAGQDPDKMQSIAMVRQEVERQFAQASADDGYRQVRGRRFRMGGY